MLCITGAVESLGGLLPVSLLLLLAAARRQAVELVEEAGLAANHLHQLVLLGLSADAAGASRRSGCW